MITLVNKQRFDAMTSEDTNIFADVASRFSARTKIQIDYCQLRSVCRFHDRKDAALMLSRMDEKRYD